MKKQKALSCIVLTVILILTQINLNPQILRGSANVYLQTFFSTNYQIGQNISENSYKTDNRLSIVGIAPAAGDNTPCIKPLLTGGVFDGYVIYKITAGSLKTFDILTINWRGRVINSTGTYVAFSVSVDDQSYEEVNRLSVGDSLSQGTTWKYKNRTFDISSHAKGLREIYLKVFIRGGMDTWACVTQLTATGTANDTVLDTAGDLSNWQSKILSNNNISLQGINPPSDTTPVLSVQNTGNPGDIVYNLGKLKTLSVCWSGRGISGKSATLQISADGTNYTTLDTIQNTDGQQNAIKTLRIVDANTFVSANSGGTIYLKINISSGTTDACVSTLYASSNDNTYSTDTSGMITYPVFPYTQTDYNENYRNQFHFSTQNGWQSDVNGLVYLDGEYHLFYQHYLNYPENNKRTHIGHAVSRDLIHWTQLPVATQPGVMPGEYNFSGTVVVDNNNNSGLKSGDTDVMIMYYTAVDYGISMAYSNDRGRTWKSYTGNPIIYTSPTNWMYPRDPKILYYAPTNKWIMILYEDGSTFYSSDNLRDWTKVGNISFGFECPDLFQMAVDNNQSNKKWVLQDASGKYLLGEFNGTTFIPDNETPQKMDNGPDFYAAQTMSTNNTGSNRIVQIGWMHLWGRPELPTQGWTNSATFPVELSLVTTPNGLVLTRTPISEISQLYSQTYSNFTARSYNQNENPLLGITGNKLDMTLEADLSKTTATSFGFKIANYELKYDAVNKTINNIPVTIYNNKIKIRVVKDIGSVEIFVNDGQLSYTTEFQFDLNRNDLSLTSNGNVYINSLVVNKLNRAWDMSSHEYPQPQSNVKTNLSGIWNTRSGKWIKSLTGIHGQVITGADAIYEYTGNDVSDMTNFSFETDLSVNQGLGGVIFRATNDFSSYYCMTIQRCYEISSIRNKLRLYRKTPVGDIDIAVYNMPADAVAAGNNGKVIEGKPYHLKIVANGSNIKVYLGSNLAIEANDSNITGDKLGLDVWGYSSLDPQVPGGYANFNNLIYSQNGFIGNINTNWLKVDGNWNDCADGLEAVITGAAVNALKLSNTTGDNFVLETAINHNSNSAGVVFRTDSNGNGYKVLVDRQNKKMDFYRGSTLIKSMNISIDFSLATNLKVIAYNQDIRVFLNQQECMRVNDSAYSSGYVGLVAEGVNGTDSRAMFNNVTIRAAGNNSSVSRLFSYNDEITDFDELNNAVVNVTANTAEQYMPLISALSTDPNACVSIVQAGIGFDKKATVTVTAENGVDKTVYTVSFNPTIPVSTLSFNNKINKLQVGSKYHLVTNLPDNYNQAIKWTSDNQNVLSVDSNGILTALSEGTATIKAAIADYECSLSVICQNDLAVIRLDSLQNVVIKNKAGDAYSLPLTDAFSVVSGSGTGTVSSTADGMTVQAAGGMNCNFILNTPVGKNYTIEADAKMFGGAGMGLLINAKQDGSTFYCTNIQEPAWGKAANIWRPGVGVEMSATPVPNLQNNVTYHLKVEVANQQMKYYIDGNLIMTKDIIEAINGADNIYVGFNVFNNKGAFSNVVVTKNDNLIDSIKVSGAHEIGTNNLQNVIIKNRLGDAYSLPLTDAFSVVSGSGTGTVSSTADGMTVQAAGGKNCNLILGTHVGKNYTIEADAKLFGGAALGFLINANQNGSKFYCANIQEPNWGDTSIIWRPGVGVEMKASPKPIILNNVTYHLKVEVLNKQFTFYINGSLIMTKTIVDAMSGADNIYAGFNFFNNKGAVSNVVVTRNDSEFDFTETASGTTVTDLSSKNINAQIHQDTSNVPSINVTTHGNLSYSINYPTDLPGAYSIMVTDTSGIISAYSLNLSSSVGFGSYNVYQNTISNVQPNTHVGNLLDNISLGVGTSYVFKYAGNVLERNSIMGSGTTVDVLNGNITTTYTVVVYGDVNGDSNITPEDLVIMRDCILQKQTATETILKAGDLYREGGITLNSLTGLMDHITEYSEINQNQPYVIKSIQSTVNGILNAGTRKHIKLLGDSITAGVGGTGYAFTGELITRNDPAVWYVNANGHCWANSLKGRIESNYNCEVKNWGTSGVDSAFILNQINMGNLIQSDDDLIILMIGTNDRLNFSGSGSVNTLYQNLCAIVDKVHSMNKEIILMSNIPASAANENSTTELKIFHMPDVDKAVCRAAAYQGAEYISLYQLFTQHCSREGITIDSLLKDGLHPSDAGYDVMYNLVSNALGVLNG